MASPRSIGAGNTHLQLTVNLSGPPEADGHLGPIVGLIDGDGTHDNYAWYGQTLGSSRVDDARELAHVGGGGRVQRRDSTCRPLTHMHMQLDPGGFGTSGAYTIEWQDLAADHDSGTGRPGL